MRCSRQLYKKPNQCAYDRNIVRKSFYSSFYISQSETAILTAFLSSSFLHFLTRKQFIVVLQKSWKHYLVQYCSVHCIFYIPSIKLENILEPNEKTKKIIL